MLPDTTVGLTTRTVVSCEGRRSAGSSAPLLAAGTDGSSDRPGPAAPYSSGSDAHLVVGWELGPFDGVGPAAEQVGGLVEVAGDDEVAPLHPGHHELPELG